MSDPMKIKPEELWGVWDSYEPGWWVDCEDFDIVVMSQRKAEEYAQSDEGLIASPIVDLSGWVRKEDAQ